MLVGGGELQERRFDTVWRVAGEKSPKLRRIPMRQQAFKQPLRQPIGVHHGQPSLRSRPALYGRRVQVTELRLDSVLDEIEQNLDMGLIAACTFGFCTKRELVGEQVEGIQNVYIAFCPGISMRLLCGRQTVAALQDVYLEPFPHHHRHPQRPWFGSLGHVDIRVVLQLGAQPHLLVLRHVQIKIFGDRRHATSARIETDGNSTDHRGMDAQRRKQGEEAFVCRKVNGL